MPAHHRADEEPEYTEHDDFNSNRPYYQPEPDIPLYYRMAGFDDDTITREQYDRLKPQLTRPLTNQPIQRRDANHHRQAGTDHYEAEERAVREWH
jgi:hypothetical protein